MSNETGQVTGCGARAKSVTLEQRRLAGAVLLGCALAGVSCVKFASELDALEGAEPVRAAASESGGALANDEGAPLPGRDWSCAVGSAAQPSGADDQAPLTYVVDIEHFITGQPLTAARVRACFRADVSCGSPLSEAVVEGSTSRVQVAAYEGFNGYLEITAAGMLPYLVFFGPWSPALLAELDPVPLRVLPEQALQALGSTANLPLDPGAGVVAVATLDCAGASAGGVRLELDRGAVPYAFVDDLPVINRDSTSSQGLAGFVNVPPGIVVVTGYRDGVSEPVGVESMLVRPGWVSSSFLLPAFAR
jgi:hypothetical protein